MVLRRLLPRLSAFVIVSAVCSRAAETTVAGYWEGNVSLPNRELEIRVELSGGAGSPWKGTIDIPLQGMRGFALGGVKVDGAAVEFALPGIPGDPRFAGKLAADAESLAGDFRQGDNTFPFRIERKVKPAAQAFEEVPAKGVPGKGLAGKWRGSIKPMPGMELRLDLELTADSAGKHEGVVISLDQGNTRIPVSSLTERAGAVRFETPAVGGTFEGKVSDDGSEIAGEWTQMGRSTPLVFKRLPTKAG